MNKTWKAKWVKALRSGKYKQGFRRLVGRDFVGNKRYCCLGVLGSLCRAKEALYEGGSVTYLFTNTLHKTGLSDNTQMFLSILNDKKRLGFEKIASWIVKNL